MACTHVARPPYKTLLFVALSLCRFGYVFLRTNRQTTRNAPSEGRMESLRRGASGMDAARAVKGHGWPLRGDPRSGDGVREVSRSETRMQGQAFLVTFSAFGKSDSPSRAKPMPQPAPPSGPLQSAAPLGPRLGRKSPKASRPRLLPRQRNMQGQTVFRTC